MDMDISKFFDEIDHELMLKSVEAMFAEKWVKVYVQRWLEMKIEKADGTQLERGGKGTPQGGVISPLLANLFLHFTLDKWLEKHYPQVKFVRYADDVIVHCRNEAEAQQLRTAIEQRLQQVGLRLNEQKTKIVYCKDYRRREKSEQVQFEFLGFSYQPRPMLSKVYKNRNFTVFVPEISRDNQKKIIEEIRKALNWANTTLTIEQIAERLNSKLRGWINYFGIYGKRKLRRALTSLDKRLVRWLSRKHKLGSREAATVLVLTMQQQPTLFYHWEKKYYYFKR